MHNNITSFRKLLTCSFWQLDLCVQISLWQGMPFHLPFDMQNEEDLQEPSPKAMSTTSI